MNNKTVYVYSIITLIFIAACYIVSSAFLGVNGFNSWRQSTTYAHILSFIGHKGYMPLDSLFWEDKNVFDIPIYQYLIAKITFFVKSEPLVVTRFFNIALWLLSVYSGAKISYYFAGKVAAFVFILLFCTSPFILHYYSIPLPDLLAIALSLYGLYKYLINKNLIFLLPLLFIAALVNYPATFAIVIFLFFYLLLGGKIEKSENSNYKNNLAKIFFSVLFVIVTALLAELGRNWLMGNKSIAFLDDAIWHLGTLEIIKNEEFWINIWYRFEVWQPYWFNYVFIVCALLGLILYFNRNTFAFTLSAIITLIISWGVFGKGHLNLDYYQLPLAIIVFLAIAHSLGNIAKLINKINNIGNSKLWSFLLIILVTLSLLQIIYQPQQSVRSRINPFIGYEYALGAINAVLYVDNNIIKNPTLAASMSTKFLLTSQNDFEANCDELIKVFPAIIVNGKSKCLSQNKPFANYFFEDYDKTYYIKYKN